MHIILSLNVILTFVCSCLMTMNAMPMVVVVIFFRSVYVPLFSEECCFFSLCFEKWLLFPMCLLDFLLFLYVCSHLVHQQHLLLILTRCRAIFFSVYSIYRYFAESLHSQSDGIAVRESLINVPLQYDSQHQWKIRISSLNLSDSLQELLNDINQMTNLWTFSFIFFRISNRTVFLVNLLLVAFSFSVHFYVVYLSHQRFNIN